MTQENQEKNQAPQESVLIQPMPLMKFEAHHYTVDTFNALLVAGHENKVSDISLDPNQPPWVRQEGQWHPVNDTPVRESEIEALMKVMTSNAAASSNVITGYDQDFAYEVTVGRGERVRFRVNATGCKIGNEVGVSLVLRTISPTPKSIHTMSVESHIVDSIMPLYGLVLVTGPVGSGKTTLLASVMREILVNRPKKVITYEDPVEFDLVNIPNRKGIVTQTEVHRGLIDFSRAPRNSLRRAADVILFGESRDHDTLRNLSIIAETGVAVYTTIHTNSVSETISRIVREFPINERDGLASALVMSMRLIVHQRLFRNREGRRIPLREYLVFTEDMRQMLVKMNYDELSTAIEKLVEEHGQSLIASARKSYEAGDLCQADFDEIVALKVSEKKMLY